MIQFPETAQVEWDTIAQVAKMAKEVRARIERGVAVEKEVEKLKVRHEGAIIFQQGLDADLTPPVVIETMAEYLSHNTPALVDIIEGVMKDGGLCLLMGPSGAGKSSVAVQMIHSLLTGTDWLGQPVLKINGSAGLLSYDQSVAIPINWMSQMGVPTDRVSAIDLNGKGNPLNVPAERSKIVRAWRKMNVEVVIIDSFSASFSGDQNDAGLVMAYYSDMKRFALGEVGAKALVVLVHSTKASPKKVRGSTVHNDVADSMVVVSRLATNERKIEMEKYRAGLGQEEMNPVIVTKPDSVTHLVELDLGAMSLANMDLPVGAAALAFPNLTAPTAAPNTDSDSEEEDDDL